MTRQKITYNDREDYDGWHAWPAAWTLATTRAAIVAILNILDEMYTMLKAMARMLVALRNKSWPDL
jgi:hypothetical protein